MAIRQPELWVVRHGETEWSRSGRHTGRTDVPLTPAGQREAATLRGRLAGHRFSMVLASPLRRAWDTCRLAGLGEAAEPCPDLLEWDYGSYEGRTTEEIREGRSEWVLWTSGAPGGESAEQVGVRARLAIERASRATGDVVLFAHGHLLRVLAACWIGLPPREGQRFALGTASVGILGHEGETRVIRSWNQGPGAP